VLWEDFILMIAELLDCVFGCGHHRYSFPITVRSRSRSQAASLTGTYVVCLDCGKEMSYDWNEMKVISSAAEKRNYMRSLATKQAA
jgi:RNase P subunit RPR2